MAKARLFACLRPRGVCRQSRSQSAGHPRRPGPGCLSLRASSCRVGQRGACLLWQSPGLLQHPGFVDTRGFSFTPSGGVQPIRRWTPSRDEYHAKQRRAFGVRAIAGIGARARCSAARGAITASLRGKTARAASPLTRPESAAGGPCTGPRSLGGAACGLFASRVRTGAGVGPERRGASPPRGPAGGRGEREREIALGSNRIRACGRRGPGAGTGAGPRTCRGDRCGCPGPGGPVWRAACLCTGRPVCRRALFLRRGLSAPGSRCGAARCRACWRTALGGDLVRQSAGCLCDVGGCLSAAGSAAGRAIFPARGVVAE